MNLDKPAHLWYNWGTMGITLPTSPKPRHYEPKEFHARHDEIIRLKLSGMKHTDIATELGITPAAVNYTVNGVLGKARMGELRLGADLDAGDTYDLLAQAAPDAAEFLAETLGNVETPTTERIRVAQDILDRTGHGKVHKVQQNINHNGSVGIARIKERAVELGIIDVIAEESTSTPTAAVMAVPEGPVPVDVYAVREEKGEDGS